MNFFSLILFFSLLLTYCSTVKETETGKPSISQTPSASPVDDGMIEIKKPFEGKAFQNDSEHFRAVASSESENLSQSSEKALLSAKQRLASLMENTVKSVSDRYAQDRQLSNRAEFQEKMENLTRSVVNQKLKKVNVIGDKTFKMKDKNKYISWVAVEMPVSAILPEVEKAIEQKITKDEKLRQDYDKMKFEETFNDEMEKLKSAQTK